MCKRIGLIGFELNRQILDYLVRFFGLKFSVQLKILVNLIFALWLGLCFSKSDKPNKPNRLKFIKQVHLDLYK
jgi:hypothetical protein